MQPIHFTIPLRTPSLTNQRMHWAVKAKQAKTQRSAAMAKCPKWTQGPLLVVTLFRYGVRALDSGNLPAALKSVQDGIASRLRVDDASGLVEWRYAQGTCPFGKERVEVVILPTGHAWEAQLIQTKPSYAGRVSYESIPTPAVYRPK